MLKALFRCFFIFLVFAPIVACTFIKPTPQSLNSDIDTWLNLNQYDKIDYALNKPYTSKPEFKEVLKRKASIIQKKNRYIENSSKTAQKHKSNFKWQKALDTYDTALNTLENQPRLTKERKELIKQRDNHITNLRKDLLMNRANALISYKKTYSTLNKLIPDDRSAQYDINRYEDEKEHLANQLQRCGEQAIINNQYTLARDCYLLSNRLMPSDKKLSFVNNLEKQLKTQANEKRFKELLSAYDEAYDKKIYGKARAPLQTIIAIDKNHNKAHALLKSLNQEIDSQLEKLITKGEELYSEKKITEALNTWKQAKKLAPDNKKLTQLIIRAEKVNKKLQRLKHGQ